MKTRTRNALAIAVFGAAIAASLAWVASTRPAADRSRRAVDAVPAGAILLATVDLDALRGSPIGAAILREGREVPGVGKLRDVCGFEPTDAISEVAFAIPAAGDSGEFGLAAAGPMDDAAILACAAKVIEARGGRPVVTPLGGFAAVRDASRADDAGEIAVERAAGGGGRRLLLLGGGVYFRAMIDAAERRGPTIRASAAHGELAKLVGPSQARLTVVLTPAQRGAIAKELEATGGSPGNDVAAAALGLDLAAEAGLHAVVVCGTPAGAESLQGAIERARRTWADDVGAQLVGFGKVLERVEVTREEARVHARVRLPVDEAALLVDRALTLQGFRHPMPKAPFAKPGVPPGVPAAPVGSAPHPSPPDEVVAPRPARSAGPSAPPGHR